MTDDSPTDNYMMDNYMKAMMDAGRDPRGGIFLSLELIVSWLLAVAYRIAFHVYCPQQVGRFGIARGYAIVRTSQSTSIHFNPLSHDLDQVQTGSI